MISVARATEAKDYDSKNQGDLLQPYKYQVKPGQQGEYVKNPDFVNKWGDPEKLS